MSELFKTSPLFADSMVLQREKKVPVWGTGADGEKVVVECGGHKAETTVSGGRWLVHLPPMGAGGPYELTVASGGRTTTFKDVLFGDVWLAGGQSNMEWRLAETTGAAKEIASANYPTIRQYDVPRIEYEDGQEHATEWKVCNPKNAPMFSGVAYYFATYLQRSLQIPIGIIYCNWGGTSASSWVAEEYLRNDPDLKVYLDEFAAKVEGFSWEKFEEEQKEHQERIAAYERRAAEGKKGEELGDYPWPPPFSPRTFMRPNGLYETMLMKAAPYALKGFIYYQGESDAHRALVYDKLLEALIVNWRTVWEDDKLPFLFVQLPVWAADGNPDGEDWPLLRESQRIAADRVPNTGMAVALEHGEYGDIHPRNKKPVGDRLALVALEKVYGKDIESSGPIFAGLKDIGDKAVLSFDHLAGGLAVRDGELRGFEVAGEDGTYAMAQAEIRGETVEVWSKQVTQVKSVRYGWANYTEANLIGGSGLPAEPFRTEGGRT